MKSKKIKILIGVFLILGVSIVFNVNSVSASIWDSVWKNTGEQETIEFLQKYQDYLSYGSFPSSIGYWFGWLLIKGLFKMVSFLEGLIPDSLNLLDFLDDAGMQGIVKAVVNDLVLVLMILVLVYLGFKTVIAKNPPNFKSVGVNIFISAFLILGMPTLMNTMQDISLDFYDATQTGQNNGQIESLSWSLIQDNTADLLYVSSMGFSILDDPSGVKNALTPETFKAANLNSLITPETIRNRNMEGTEIENLKYRLDTNENGEIVADKIEDSAFGFLSDSFDQGYFRYQTKFIPIIVGLGALAVAYIFTIFVFATTVVEIGFKQVIGLFVFATDLESGQRTKMVVQDIANAFMLIGFTGLSLKMYTLFLSFLGTKDPNFIIYTVAIISATVVLIKGSSTIMRYFGVDVGLKEGFGQLAGAFALGRGTANVARKIKNSGKAGQAEDHMQSINNQNRALNHHGGLKKSINSTGKSFGYARTRGVGGIAEDVVKGTGEKMVGGLKNSVNSMKSQWTEGVDQGTTKGKMNQEKWNNKKMKGKSINDMAQSPNEMKKFDDSIISEQSPTSSIKDRQSTSGKQMSINDQEAKQKPTMGSYSQENGVQDQPFTNSNKPGNTLQNQNAMTQSNEEILTKMKLEDAMNPKNMDATGTVKMKTDIDGNGEIKQRVSESMSGDKGQKVNTINDQGHSSLQNATQRVIQQIEKTSFSNPENAKQSIIQEVQKNSFGSNDVKQKVIQEIEKSNAATPQQLKQDIKQIFSTANVPNEVQSSVQKIIQEVQSSGSYKPQDIKANVVEEIKKAPIDNHSVKQNVVQEVAVTSDQQKQNVEQVIETKGNQRYFGTLIPDDLKIKPIPRKEERFKGLKDRKL